MEEQMDLEGGEKPKGIEDVVPVNESGYLTQVASPEAIERAHSKEIAKITEDAKPDLINPLVGFFLSIISENQDHRIQMGVEDALIDCEERSQSKYSEGKLSEIREFGGSEAYAGLTGVKVRAANAWITEILSTDRQQLWRIEPTPIVDISSDLAESIADLAVQRIKKLQVEAKNAGTPLPKDPGFIYDLAAGVRDEVLAERREGAIIAAERMERVIQDQLTEGGFNVELNKLLGDVCRSKGAILKGPIPTLVKTRAWKEGKDGVPTVVIEEKIVPKVYRIDPQDIFPAPTASTVNCGSLVERVTFDRGTLASLRDVAPYSKSAIENVLTDFGGTQDALQYSSTNDDLKGIDRTQANVLKNSVTGWEVWARVPGDDLKTFGLSFELDGKTPLDEFKTYDMNAIIVDTELIFLDHNPDPLGKRPYHLSGWGEVPGSFWFEGIPELMTDIQDICNASVRALSNNMAFSSGPQTVINDIERLPDGEELTPPAPFKLWQFVASGAKTSGKPIDFFQPASNAAELLGVYSHFAKLADDYTGIPAYAYGNDKVAGAGRTASGLSMLMNSAARGVKRVVLRFDEQIINTLIKSMYYYNLQYNADTMLRNAADINVVPTGAIQIMIKEQMAQRRLEFLQATMNDLDFKLVGEQNRARLLQDVASTLDLEFDIVKTRDEIKQMIEGEAAQAKEAREREIAELDRRAQKEEAEIALKAAEIAIKQQEAGDKAPKETNGTVEQGQEP